MAQDSAKANLLRIFVIAGVLAWRQARWERGAFMTVFRGFAIIVASGFGFAAGGGVIGYLLALVVPSYYRNVFRDGHSDLFDPVQVGIGLGVSQGLIVGLVVGAVVVLAVALAGSRLHRKERLNLD